MRQSILIFGLIFLPGFFCNAQSNETKTTKDDTEMQKLWLLSDTQVLETKSVVLDKPLARALAKAEIAGAMWMLDQPRAENLLREAYELTLPNEDERNRLRSRPIGAALTGPMGSNDIARNGVRNRVLEIARQDKAFATELIQQGAQQLGKMEEHYALANLAEKAVGAGDIETAGNYITQSFEAEPTLINAGIVIIDVAARDRKAADKLIIQYIERLRSVPLSLIDQSASRTFTLLKDLIFKYNDSMFFFFNNRRADPRYRQILPPGPDVMRAYVHYVIDSLSQLEQREPGSLMRSRNILLSAWLPLKQYAPELAGQFLELEKLSRRPGEDASLPQRKNEQANKSNADYEKRVKDALDSDKPDDLTINFALSRGDFDKARKLIDKLSDGAQKTQFIEDINTREAISLATKGDTLSAQSLAEKLSKAVSVLQVYPLIINKCAAKKDQQCTTTAFYQALRQLKKSDVTPNAPPAGIPASVVPTSKEFDPVLSSLSKLAKAVAPVSDEFALEALDEMVQAANRSEVDTSQGRIGFDADVFKLIAAKNEPRAQQAALNLKDELRQIVALATIDQWKAKELADKIKAADKAKAAGAARKNGDDKKK